MTAAKKETPAAAAKTPKSKEAPYKITKDLVMKALKLFKAPDYNTAALPGDKEPRKFPSAKAYALVHDGKHYAPKSVLSVAVELLTGKPYPPSKFVGGNSKGGANTVLRTLGFAVEAKKK